MAPALTTTNSTAELWGECRACGWPVICLCVNPPISDVEPYKGSDWWVYCSNPLCPNHSPGDYSWQGDPEWVTPLSELPERQPGEDRSVWMARMQKHFKAQVWEPDGGDLTACEEAGCFCEATKSAPVDARRTLTAKTWTLLSGLSLEGFTIQAVSVNPTGTLTVDFLLNAASDNLNVVRDRILWELGEAFSTRAGEVSYSMAARSDPLIEASMQIDLGPRFELDPLSSPG